MTKKPCVEGVEFPFKAIRGSYSYPVSSEIARDVLEWADAHPHLRKQVLKGLANYTDRAKDLRVYEGLCISRTSTQRMVFVILDD